MATIAARRAQHVPIPILLAIVAVTGIAVGALTGYVAARATATPAAVETTPVAAQVAADNALVDRWMTAQNTGDQSAVVAMLRPNFRYQDNIGLSQRNAAGMWAQVLDSRNAGMVHERTGDVARVGDVLFWGARITYGDGATRDYTWMVRLDPDGRFVNAWATTQ